MRLCLTIACAAIAPVLVAASQPVRLQPSSPWDVDYGENSCRLIRTFAEGKEKTVLVFESAGPGQMDLLVVGNGLKVSECRGLVPSSRRRAQAYPCAWSTPSS